MTIRARLSLWYAGVLFSALLAMGALAYYEFVAEPRLHPPGAPGEEAAGDEGLGDVISLVLWCGVPAAALGLAGGWWLTRQALAPVAALTHAAERITEHNLSARLPQRGTGDELDRLTEVFNGMTARLDGSFQRIREFTLHASHELKTPLTVLHGELETALQDAALSTAQRERVLSELDEVQRLAKIVDGLTLLTKADAGQIPLAREPVRLDELLRDACADGQSLAQPRAVQVTLTACAALTVTGDRHRLRQLLLNLTHNAVKYSEPRGVVTLGLRREGTTAEVTITNTGKGIPSEILPRVFDPFFRGDASHSQTVEGCGLGLSIARWIVTAHGGTIQLSSASGQLTVATVRLPLSNPHDVPKNKHPSTDP